MACLYYYLSSNQCLQNQNLNKPIMKKLVLTAASVFFISLMAANAQVSDTTKRQGSSQGTGTSGTTGSQGTSGTSGTSGSQGTSGTSGSQGTSGTSGTSGSQGTSGTSGTSSTSTANKKDMVRVQPSEIPASLRKTLEDPMYAGWENSTIYRNKSNNEYVVEIKNTTGTSSSSASATKTYRFDKNGKPVIDDQK
jgi:hypothetical protein